MVQLQRRSLASRSRESSFQVSFQVSGKGGLGFRVGSLEHQHQQQKPQEQQQQQDICRYDMGVSI